MKNEALRDTLVPMSLEAMLSEVNACVCWYNVAVRIRRLDVSLRSRSPTRSRQRETDQVSNHVLLSTLKATTSVLNLVQRWS